MDPNWPVNGIAKIARGLGDEATCTGDGLEDEQSERERGSYIGRLLTPM